MMCQGHILFYHFSQGYAAWNVICFTKVFNLNKYVTRNDFTGIYLTFNDITGTMTSLSIWGVAFFLLFRGTYYHTWVFPSVCAVLSVTCVIGFVMLNGLCRTLTWLDRMTRLHGGFLTRPYVDSSYASSSRVWMYFGSKFCHIPVK